MARTSAKLRNTNPLGNPVVWIDKRYLQKRWCHVWTVPFLQGFFLGDVDHCGLQSCVRPVDATHMAAGLDEVRAPGPKSDKRAFMP